MGLHLKQAAQGALELEVQAPALVQIFKLDFSRDDQLYAPVIELIDHVDKASRDVVSLDVHLFHTM